MPLDTYANLQASILSWLARPGDPLVSPSIPDIIQLFESEATRRLKVAGAEKRVSLTALSAAVALPADFGELRLATSGGVILTYVTPMQLPDGGGPPAHYTIIGNEMRLGPSPSGGCTVEIVYQSGVPPLSDTNTTNWLLTAHPDCYLFGSLVEAESFIGSDERIPLWAQRREAAFASIETADRKARWGGAPLSIRAEGVSGGNGAAGGATSTPAVSIPISIANGGTGSTTAPAALTALGAVAKAGDTMTGDLTLSKASGNANLILSKSASGQHALINGSLAGAGRWLMSLGDDAVESGSNTGSNFALFRTSDAGGLTGALSINRATGNAAFAGDVMTAGSHIAAAAAPSPVVAVNTMYGGAISGSQTLSFNAYFDGSAHHARVTGYTHLINADGTGQFALFISSASVTAGAAPSYTTRMVVNGVSGACTNTSGTWAAISDARLKKDIEPYNDRGLAEILRIEPKRFRYNGQGGMPDDGVTHYGLIADEVEGILPELVGEIDLAAPDSPADIVKTVDPGRLIYTLITAVKELAAKVAALEASK